MSNLPPDILESAILARNFDNLGEAEQVDRRAAGLENNEVWCDEE
jgi:hypothetical protein